jgi:HAD superfamily hydrolase (TIGR01509 family)
MGWFRKMLSAVIFDWDGTLVDSLEVHIKAWKKTFAEFGVDVKLDEIGSRFGKPTKAILSEALPPRLHRKIPELIKRKRKYFSENLALLKLYPGVENVLEKLRERSVPMALASSMSRKSLYSSLEALGIEEYFDVIVTVEDVSEGKPNPEMLLRAAEKLRIKPENCLVVGDSIFDALAAERANMSIVVVANNPYQIGQIREMDVKIVEDITEILGLL